MNIINFFHAANDIIFQYYIILLLYHFNVFGYNSTSIEMFVCFFLIYLFLTVKAPLPKKSLVFAARQIANNLSQIAKKL